MSNNGMNYSMYNNLSYPHIVRQPTLYGQQYSNTLSQPSIPPAQYAMYPTQQPSNSYDHLIQSAAKTLAAFTHPSELSIIPNQLSRLSQQNSHRRSGNNSSTTTNSIRMYYCEICRIACGGHTSYQAHLNGIKHKKKEQNSQNQQTNQKTFRCELCDITCTSSDAYQAHLDGSKHEKAVKLHRKLGKTIPECVHESQTIVDKQLTENNSQFIGIEYIETSYDETNTPKCYYCKLCDCKFHDANGRDAHLKGKRHRLSYKKKVDPNFQIDTTKASSPKQQRSNEIIENYSDQQINTNNQTEIDDNTKFLMGLHQQIIPSQNQLDRIEDFISAVEAALKSCSDQLRPSLSFTIDPTSDKSPLMGVSRVGSLVKNLLIKTDRLFHIVVICTEWPRVNLFEKIASLLPENFHETWSNRIHFECQRANEIIQITTEIDEGQISVSISFTTLSIQHENIQTPEEFLTKTNCLNALYSMHSVRWFQNQVSKRQYASALIRCLRYKTKISYNWQSLSSEVIEILIEKILSEPLSPIVAFRRVLEYLSGGLILSNGPGLRIPWQTDSIKNALDYLNDQERNDITYEAQIGLRLLTFGQLNKWLEESDNLHIGKRSYTDEDNQVSAKRQCTENQ
jgi:hypothetical protein